MEDGEVFDFRGMRLDWFRLQAYTSVSKASLGIADHKELGKMMNTIIFHTKMVDSLVEMLVETSDLSIFWYHTCGHVDATANCVSAGAWMLMPLFHCLCRAASTAAPSRRCFSSVWSFLPRADTPSASLCSAHTSCPAHTSSVPKR